MGDELESSRKERNEVKEAKCPLSGAFLEADWELQEGIRLELPAVVIG